MYFFMQKRVWEVLDKHFRGKINEKKLIINGNSGYFLDFIQKLFSLFLNNNKFDDGM